MNLPGKCWSSVGVVPSVAAILNMAAPAVLDLGQFSAFFCSCCCCCGPGASGLLYAGARERLGISSDRGPFFIALQDSSLRAMEPQRVHEAGFSAQAQCRAHCVRGSAAFFVLLSFRERQCSEADSYFAAGHICRMHFCGYKKPFAMAHGLPGASQKSPGTLLRPFLKAGQRSLQCLDGFSGTCQSRSSGVIWRSTEGICIPEILWQSRKQVFYELVSREMEDSIRVRE